MTTVTRTDPIAENLGWMTIARVSPVTATKRITIATKRTIEVRRGSPSYSPERLGCDESVVAIKEAVDKEEMA